jgi:transcription elongation factor Elf1
MKSKYIVQFDDKTSCPECGHRVRLLCRKDGEMKKTPAFYLCHWCGHVAQVGVGPVPPIQ